MTDMRSALDRVRDDVGVVRRTDLGVISERDVGRFASVVGLTIPCDVLHDAAGVGHLVAPPTYLASVLGWFDGPDEADLLADGVDPEAIGVRGVGDGLRLRGGGQRIVFHQPVVAGTRVVMESTVVRAEHKDGRSGPLMAIELSRRYTDERGELLVECLETFLAK
jgi:hypothetical protein